MDTRESLIAHALTLIERDGIGSFSTRQACTLSGVTAPTLYHHFGNADGLISAAVLRGFEEFLAQKVSRPPAADPTEDLLAGWDDYVNFARDRPRLYSAMAARLLAGADIPAARDSRQHLVTKLQALEGARALALPVSSAADILWSTAHAAAMLWVAGTGPPDVGVIAALRQTAARVLKTNIT